MINLSEGTIVRGERREPIERWGVWMKTPFGMCETLEEAVVTVTSADLNPHMTIEPVPVAHSATMLEVYYH